MRKDELSRTRPLKFDLFVFVLFTILIVSGLFEIMFCSLRLLPCLSSWHTETSDLARFE